MEEFIEAAYATLTAVVTKSNWRYQLTPSIEGPLGTYDFNMVNGEERINLWCGLEITPPGTQSVDS